MKNKLDVMDKYIGLKMVVRDRIEVGKTFGPGPKYTTQFKVIETYSDVSGKWDKINEQIIDWKVLE